MKIKVTKSEFKSFPQVFKMVNSDGAKYVSLVFKNHSENYKFENSYYGDKEFNIPYDTDNEIRLLRENGYRRVHDNKKITFTTTTEIKEI